MKTIGIRREIIYSGGALALAIVVLFGALFSSVVYESEMGKARALIRHTNRSAELFTSRFFREMANTILVLENDSDIRDAALLGSEARERVLMTYRSFAEANPEILYIYSGYEDGSIIIDPAIWEVPEGFDSTVRPWYVEAMRARPEVAIGVPYQEYISGDWVISTSKALKQSDGRYGGALSIEHEIAVIEAILSEFGDYETGHSYMLNAVGDFILHQDKSKMGPAASSVREAIAEAEEGFFTHRIGGQTWLTCFRRVPFTGWTVVTSVDRGEVLDIVIARVAGMVVFAGAIALLLGSLLIAYLNRRVCRPLAALGRAIRAVIAGGHVSADSDVYPGNEIGAMAEDVGHLAKSELHAKALALGYQNRMQEVLMGISSTYINLPPDKTDRAVETAIGQLGSFVGADRVYVFEYDMERQVCHKTHEWRAHGIATSMDALRDAPFSLISEWVEAHRSGKAFCVSDVTALPEGDGVRRILEAEHVKTVLTAPMMTGETCAGFVGFDYVRRHHVFGEEEARLLTVFAHMTERLWTRVATEQDPVEGST